MIMNMGDGHRVGLVGGERVVLFLIYVSSRRTKYFLNMIRLFTFKLCYFPIKKSIGLFLSF